MKNKKYKYSDGNKPIDESELKNIKISVEPITDLKEYTCLYQTFYGNVPPGKYILKK